VLCAIAYYIKEKEGISKSYRIVLKKLYQQIIDFLKNYPVTITPNTPASKLRDSNYFYILNDFSFYRGFTEEQSRNINNLKMNALDCMEDNELSIYEKLMENSYFNWELSSNAFEKLLIKKILSYDSRNSNY